MQELLLRLALGTFPFEVFNDRACWGITLLISCWYVWRDIVKGRLLEDNKSEQRPNEQSGDGGKDFGSSGRTPEEVELDVHEEPQEESQVNTIYDSENTIAGPRASGRTGSWREAEIDSGRLRVPEVALSGRLQGPT